MHNFDDKNSTRQEFEPSTSEFRAPIRQSVSSKPGVLYDKHPREVFQKKCSRKTGDANPVLF